VKITHKPFVLVSFLLVVFGDKSPCADLRRVFRR
jgi:hypothetical protein